MPHVIDKTIHGLGDAEDFVENWQFESLWVNDQEAIRARVPSSWTLPTIKSVSTSGSGEFITYTVGVPSNTMKFLRDLSSDELHQVNIVIFHYWSTTRARISSIDINSNTITFASHSPNLGNNKGIEAAHHIFILTISKQHSQSQVNGTYQMKAIFIITHEQEKHPVILKFMHHIILDSCTSKQTISFLRTSNSDTVEETFQKQEPHEKI